MLYRLRTGLQRKLHNRAISGVLDTPPLAPTRDRIVFMSMVCHADLLMYLVAVKSVFNRIGKGRVVFLNDGSLTAEDIDILKRHLADPQIVHIKDVPTPHTPKGGCWERLLTCVDLSKDDFVMQVDSDIVAAGPMPDVAAAIEAGAPFTIGTKEGQKVVSFDDAAALARSRGEDHIQLVAERAFASMPNKENLGYIRGCAAFTGFAKDGISRAFVEDFSEKMQGLIGARWSEWGTEQVASNVAVANSTNARVLPIDRYKNYFPPMDVDSAAVMHFLGTHRFSGGHYTRLSRRFIEAARRSAAA
jgi:hypothetical protein